MTVPSIAGTPVREARELVEKLLAGTGGSLELQEFSKPVICRNGHRVGIRKVSDQWFLRYSDPDWKARALEAARAIATWPPEYGRELPGIVEWFADRPCARKGPWLGTPLPFDPELDHRADRRLDVLHGLLHRAAVRRRRVVSFLLSSRTRSSTTSSRARVRESLRFRPTSSPKCGRSSSTGTHSTSTWGATNTRASTSRSSCTRTRGSFPPSSDRARSTSTAGSPGPRARSSRRRRSTRGGFGSPDRPRARAVGGRMHCACTT